MRAFARWLRKRERYIFPTGCPPADSVIRLRCLMKENWFSWAAMKSFLRMRAESIMSFGTPRRSIIRRNEQALMRNRSQSGKGPPAFYGIDSMSNKAFHRKLLSEYSANLQVSQLSIVNYKINCRLL